MNNKIIELTDIEFYEIINKSKVPVLVEFWASWCSSCKMQTPIIVELAEDLKNKAIFCKLNIDAYEEVAIKNEVKMIPFLGVYYKGSMVTKSVGLTSKSDISLMLIKYV